MHRSRFGRTTQAMVLVAVMVLAGGAVGATTASAEPEPPVTPTAAAPSVITTATNATTDTPATTATGTSSTVVEPSDPTTIAAPETGSPATSSLSPSAAPAGVPPTGTTATTPPSSTTTPDTTAPASTAPDTTRPDTTASTPPPAVLGVGGTTAAVGAIEVFPTYAFRSRIVTATPAGPGDHYAVHIGDEVFPAPAATAQACSTGVWILRFSRTTLALVTPDPAKKESTVYPLCDRHDAAALDAHLRAIPSTEMVVVNSLNRAPGGQPLTLSGLTTALGRIGVAAADVAGLNLATTSFSVWGIGALTAGQAYLGTGDLADESAAPAGAAAPASLSGDLISDSAGHFALQRTDSVLYDIAVDGTVTIGDSVNPAADPTRPAALGTRVYPVPGGRTGGFHIVVLDSRSLELVDDNFYATYDNRDEQFRMGRDLADLAADHDGEVLLFLAAVGVPMAASPGPRGTLPTGPITLPAPCTGSSAFVVTCTFRPTGGEQKFTVPGTVGGVAVDRVSVVAQGGRGGGTASDGGGTGGAGAVVTADLPIDGSTLTAGQTVWVEVGGNGGDGGRTGGGQGGWNGGGPGGDSQCCLTGWPGGGGGGASDLRTVSRTTQNLTTSLTSRFLVAAGGGGAGGEAHDGGRGGSGGQGGSDGFPGLPGDEKAAGGGAGRVGTKDAGGAGGAGTHPGRPGEFGIGGTILGYVDRYGAAGGGGSGWWGGGAGGEGANPGGGGGGGGAGSNLVPTGGTVEPAGQTTDGSVTISYHVPYGSLADALRPFGATPTVVAGLTSVAGYALVGSSDAALTARGLAPDSPEASGKIKANATGELQGVLQPGHDGRFASVVSDAPTVSVLPGSKGRGIRANFGLYQIFSSTPQAWPVPVAGDAGQQKAYEYLSRASCGCADIRGSYRALGSVLDEWRRDIDQQLFGAVPPGSGFDSGAFDAVKTQLLAEIPMVKKVRELETSLHTALTDSYTMIGTQLTTTLTAIRADLAPDAGDILVEKIFDVFIEAALAGAGGEDGAPEDVVKAVSVVISAARSGLDLVNDPGGRDRDLGMRVDRIAADLPQQFSDAISAQARMFGLVYSDWGRLSTLATNLSKHQADWDPSAADPGKVLRVQQNAMQLSFYRVLVSITHTRWEAKAVGTDELSAWCLRTVFDHGRSVCYEPANTHWSYESSAYTYPVAAPGAAFRPAHDIMSIGKPEAGISRALVDTMTQLGLYTPYLFLRWPLDEGLTCPQSFTSGSSGFACSDFKAFGVGGTEPLTITTDQLPEAGVGDPYSAQLMTGDGQGASHSWTVVAGSTLPPGLTLSGSGLLSGTPTTAGTYTFSVRVDDSVDKELTLLVRPGLAATGVPLDRLAGLTVVLLFAGMLLLGTARRRRVPRT
ncbi:hypothetical protein GIS00_18975 [Nakamurella sp. YIM 132087]|uniref:receptor protein-tyrosine kinase n=1 Tax=Nakamurella alba TaxID=2665158 RepID=A0A7K1FS09_9ACTN|nr:glycine-rich protein [Nakamurella alba]MTD16023.1 hypothetical protein [Nakamurella alba]